MRFYRISTYICPVKLLSLLLALLVLCLSCLPCSDEVPAMALQISSPAHIPADTDHPADSHEDLCSPFCQCACCAVACTVPVMIRAVLATPSPALEKPAAAYLAERPVHMALPVWQPPQLV
jgi:hypothetical protein